jgi:cellobiose phosphorylase
LNYFKTRFGYFNPNGEEYVITTPRTPRPWINVISNGDYGLTVSQTGSGYSWRTHAQLNRISRWEQDLIKDEWGKYIYLRDEKGNVWSAGWKPVCATPDFYECRHGIGYTIIKSSNHGITTELLIFVPEDEPLEIWRLTIKNNTRRYRKIHLFTFFEWCLGQAPDWHREFHKSFISTEYDPKLSAILATKYLWEVPSDRGHWNTNWPYIAFHSSSIKPVSYDTDKESFLGMYGSISMPRALNECKLYRHSGKGLDAIASLYNRVELEPKGSKSIVYTLGAAKSKLEAVKFVSSYKDLKLVSNALEKVRVQWSDRLSKLEVETPDKAMNIMLNKWLKYQTISGRIWGRSAYYQTGGAYGFRDQLQDSQLWLLIEPQKTLEQICLHAQHQYRNGSVYHWWHPITEIGLRNEISDNLLWLPFVVNNYLLETGDFGALETILPFLDDTNGATLYQHCVRAIEFALQRISERGLPLIGAGDWNDGLSAVGLDMKGESIWLAQFLHRILIDFAVIAKRLNDELRETSYIDRANSLRSAINQFGWDGKWYYGATKDSGEKLGSKENKEGTIWLNPQTWSIIADVADHNRARQVMDAVENILEVEIGPLLLRPAYRIPDRYIGYLTRYSPGMRENGGVYTHAATWAIIAAAKLGRGESAFRIFSKLNPINRGKNPEQYCAEPYVTPGNIEGPDSQFFGRGGWTWYTGSSSWLFRVGIEYILGVRPAFEGLMIDPCIPRKWKRFAIRRIFRGATYNITVENPENVEYGIAQIVVDGQQPGVKQGSREIILPLLPEKTVHNVLVVMGK